ncbi:ABC transporter ATP-binding protein [Vibrio sp. TBV020]|uniref:ABC transporter ATP-binding protein n=1 Tax=Vibrio sp. TBV020 TaxID=3137398 RepID=UPI0038CD6C35
MSNDKAIELKNVAVTYKERSSLFKSNVYTALKDVSFDVYKGETLGLIGRNGAGKSTLLRLLAGIFKPDKGEITHHTSSVSLMALAAGFDPNLSGRKNAIISGMLIGYRKKDIIEKLELIKTFSELQGFFEKPVKTYSSGMSARLAFSIAMYISPDVLLIDEVLGVGDVSFKQKAEQALEEKMASDITVIIVSHSEAQVSRLSERIVWLDGGKVRKEGEAKQIYQEYNINVRFSTYGLTVENYQLNPDFLFVFEQFEVAGNVLKFKCVLVDFKDRNVSGLFVKTEQMKHIQLQGPTATPGYKNNYEDIEQAGMARYHEGELYLDERNSITAICDGAEVEVVSLTLLENI